MATVIRMKRGGRTHAPYYRVVVIDSRSRVRGRELDAIGFYHPCARPLPLAEVDTEKALSWLALGARPSDTVKNVFTQKGIMAAHVARKLAGGAPAVEVSSVEVPTSEPAQAVSAAVEE